MSNQEETDLVHQILAHLLETPTVGASITGLFERHQVSHKFWARIEDRLSNEGLIKILPNTTGRNKRIELSTRGVTLARHAGGYRGFLAEQTLLEIDRERRERATAQATLDGVRANWWAVRVSLIGIGVSAVFSVISLIQSVDTAAELEKAQKDIVQLKQQISLLTKTK